MVIEFLNTYSEVHAVWWGFVRAFDLTGITLVNEDVALEPHYYSLGILTGRVVMLLLAAAIGGLLW